jgi:hypothetical protein
MVANQNIFPNNLINAHANVELEQNILEMEEHLHRLIDENDEHIIEIPENDLEARMINLIHDQDIDPEVRNFIQLLLDDIINDNN